MGVVKWQAREIVVMNAKNNIIIKKNLIAQYLHFVLSYHSLTERDLLIQLAC